MAGQHTPGPWRMTLDDFGDYTIQPQHEELAIAAVVNGSFKNLVGEGEEQKANACLIAAAPDLLEALHQCLGSLKALGADIGYAATTARTAIDKAEGRDV